MANLITIEGVKLSCQHCSLAELCLPRSLSDDELERFEEIVAPLPPMARGATLYRTGDRSRALYAVKSGAMKSVVSTRDGLEQIVGFHLPGELIGFDGVDALHNCTVVALDRSRVCELPLDKLENLAGQVKGLQREVYQVMRREISQEQSMLLLLARHTAPERLASFLLSLSQRLGRRGFSRQEFELPMSRHDMANYLGLAAETISRLLATLAREHVVEIHRRHVLIHDFDALKRSIGQSVDARAS